MTGRRSFAARLVWLAWLVPGCYLSHEPDPSTSPPPAAPPDCARLLRVREASIAIPDWEIGAIHPVRTGWAWIHGAERYFDEPIIASADPALTRVDRAVMSEWPIRGTGAHTHCEEVQIDASDELRLDCWVDDDALRHTIHSFGLDGRRIGAPIRTEVRGSTLPFPTVLDEAGYHTVLISDEGDLTPVRFDARGATMGETIPFGGLGGILATRWSGASWRILRQETIDFEPGGVGIWELSEAGELRQTGEIEEPADSYVEVAVLGANAIFSILQTGYPREADTLQLLTSDLETGRPLGPPTFIAGELTGPGWTSTTTRLVPEGECGAVVLVGEPIGEQRLVRVANDGSIRQAIDLPLHIDTVRWIGDRHALVRSGMGVGGGLGVTEPIE